MIKALRPHLVPFVSLLALLALTAACAFLPLRAYNIIVALAFATAKTGVVTCMFMELRKENPLIRTASGVGVVWLAIMLMLALADFLSRFPGKLAE
jgi:caa(3)-type oxidase subunit IV